VELYIVGYYSSVGKAIQPMNRGSTNDDAFVD
jgi:hypothetical protein